MTERSGVRRESREAGDGGMCGCRSLTHTVGPQKRTQHCEVMTVVVCHSVVSDSFAILWTVDHQAPLSMGFPRQEYWSELPFLSPGDLLHPGTEPESPALAGRFFASEPPGKP